MIKPNLDVHKSDVSVYRSGSHSWDTKKTFPLIKIHTKSVCVCWSLILHLRASRCKVQNHRPEHTLLICHIKGKKIPFSNFQHSSLCLMVEFFFMKCILSQSVSSRYNHFLPQFKSNLICNPYKATILLKNAKGSA